MRCVESVVSCVFGALDFVWWRFLLKKKMTISRLEFFANFFGGIVVGVIFACVVSVEEFVSLNRGTSLQSSRHEAEALTRESPAAVDLRGWRDRKNITSNDSFDDSIHLMSSEAKKISRRRQRILCLVLTSPDNIETRAVHVNRTWGRRCDRLLFITTKGRSSEGPSRADLPAVELDAPEGHDRLWGKTKAAFRYAHDRHLGDAEWFFKADDDTYAIVENLRRLLGGYDPDRPLFLGRRLSLAGPASTDAEASYMSGGAGYVLSREAVRRLAESSRRVCGDWGDSRGSEDVRMGVCMGKCSVTFVDTRDSVGRHRFHPIAPWHYLSHQVFPGDYWLKTTDYYNASKAGVECCSLYSITFHYVPDYAMYWMDFILYRFRISGSAEAHFDQLSVQKEQHEQVQRMKSTAFGQQRS